MKHRILWLILFIAFIFIYVLVKHDLAPISVSDTEPLKSPWLTILVMPLDSRPPCTQFVEELGRIANIRVILPPEELLDHFRNPSDKQALRLWLKENISQANAAIISVDMLIHGGLLSSRLSQGTVQDTQETLDLLQQTHAQNPGVAMYAFNIIPRLLIADSSVNASYKKDLLEYSILKNQVAVFENPLDYKQLLAIRSRVPNDVIQEYETLYAQNLDISNKLIHLTETGVITGLIIGQDDGNSFGIPNLIKEKLQNFVDHKPALVDRVIITRGADEIALNLLARIAAKTSGQSSQVYVTYSTDAAPTIIMPYMAQSVHTTVSEKIALIKGQEVSSLAEASFVLYVHIGSDQSTEQSLTKSALEIKNLMARGYPVAVVDLSENFYASQSLLPYLIKESVNINELAAYSGWNTTSNSVGTAVSQGMFATSGFESPDQIKQHDQAQVEFLLSRFLDDYYFQKEIQPWINKRVRNMNADPYNLPDAHYQDANDVIQLFLTTKCKLLFQQAIKRHPIQLSDRLGTRSYQINSLAVKSSLPWERTFEIKVRPIMSLIEN
jgi:hypothetical protein